MTTSIGDPFAESAPESVEVAHGSGWPVWTVIGLSLLGIVVGVLERLEVIRRSALISATMYVVVLVGGTSLLGFYRWRDGQASRERTYVPSPTMARVAVAAAVLIVVACALTGFVVSTKWSTQ
jgi:uncharacterized membrane protein YidH (DUF202 family)